MCNKIKHALQYKRILELCERRGFLKQLGDKLTIGPTGVLLIENLKSEWFRSTVTNRDVSIFANGTNFKDTFLYAKDICTNQFPFGVAEIINDAKPDGSVNFDRNDVFRCTVFTHPTLSTQFFHHLQRQRRMWWRIFSASPGRYNFADIKNGNDNDFQSVVIRADYPWTSQLVEKIKLHKNIHPDLAEEDMEGKIGKSGFVSHYVTNEVSAQGMLLNNLCDAYDDNVYQGEERPLFRFHRKLAPYKISFTISKRSSSSFNEDLLQLAVHLCKQLRENNISCLLLPMTGKCKLESQWKLYDEMGVPYNVNLNENTLKNGVVQLRSRDTTLKEQVHVGELPKYIDQLFKNY